ncbi:Guanine nucleotide-binding protein-like 1 [Nymphon striatum]|nr:Guanine nucleotide-binding protein-like 1 [Nymphon striatum]
MPNGRKKVPFSTKQKKLQMQNKRAQKQQNCHDDYSANEFQGFKRREKTSNKSSLGSYSNSRVNSFFFFLKNLLESTIDKSCESKEWLPVRPPWKQTMTKHELDSNENNYFREFTETFEMKNGGDLCCYEHNLETWRQLWRVLEMSDILLLIVDIRHPVYNFPPSLYRYICKDLRKNLVLILNKVDLVPTSVVSAWRDYFTKIYPDLKVVCFRSLPRRYKDKENNLKLKMSVVAENTRSLFQTIEDIVGDHIDIGSWKRKIEDDFTGEIEDEVKVEREEEEEEEEIPSRTSFRYEKYENGVVTLGCIGYPNVGKSSLLNTLKGRKVVSVSRTPGHTKYFQTIFLTKNVKLCDSPGLVFPSLLESRLQVLTGCMPISQLRNPFPAIEYLAERINLWDKLKLKSNFDLKDGYTALDICEAWAEKKGFYTAKAARPDTYRAANHILRLALNGEICLYFYPPKYLENRAYYEDSTNLNGSEDGKVSDNESSGEENDTSDHESETEEVNSSDEWTSLRPKNMFAVLDGDFYDS